MKEKYYTPDYLIQIMLSSINCDPKTILEPSAGDFRLCHALHEKFPKAKIIAVEKYPDNKPIPDYLTLYVEDYLCTNFAKKFDLVFMNPPFRTHQRDTYNTRKDGWKSHFIKALSEGKEVVCLGPGKDYEFDNTAIKVSIYKTIEDLKKKRMPPRNLKSVFVFKEPPGIELSPFVTYAKKWCKDHAYKQKGPKVYIRYDELELHDRLSSYLKQKFKGLERVNYREILE